MRAILTYHSIDDSGSVISVSRVTFRAQMEWLAGSGVRVVSLSGLLELPDDDDAIALTFDDAFENFATDAWPVLRDHSLQATVFVVSGHAGGTNNWSNGSFHVPQLRLLSWSDIERLAADGVTIGSHTKTHPDLRLVSDEQLKHEIDDAAETLRARIGVRPISFAFPFGAFDDRTLQAVARVHSMACTTELRSVRAGDNVHALPRLDAYYFRKHGALENFGSRAFRRYVWLRAGGRRLRQALSARTGG